MQQFILAGLVGAPIAETVQTENHYVRAVKCVKAVYCRPDVLHILFYVFCFQRFRQNHDQRLAVDLYAVAQLESIAVLEAKRNVCFEFRAAGIASSP